MITRLASDIISCRHLIARQAACSLSHVLTCSWPHNKSHNSTAWLELAQAAHASAACPSHGSSDPPHTCTHCVPALNLNTYMSDGHECSRTATRWPAAGTCAYTTCLHCICTHGNLDMVFTNRQHELANRHMHEGPAAKVQQTPHMPACPRLALAERMAGMRVHCVRTAAGHRTEAHGRSPQLLHHAECSMQGGRRRRGHGSWTSDEQSHFMK
jgi:hypothetical protein